MTESAAAALSVELSELVARARTCGLWIGAQSALFFFAIGRFEPHAQAAFEVASFVEISRAGVIVHE